MAASSWEDRVAFDVRHVWHPFTQMKEHEAAPPLPVVRADGCDLLLADGRRVFDGISSWWTNIHGHAHPRIARAIAEQAARLDHVMFAGFTHEPAIEVVERLLRRVPPPLGRVFFSDDGSTAVEVAIKMAFQAQHQRGAKQRTRLGALRGAYHGDTLGAVGVGELGNFMTALFQPLLLRCERLALPADPRCGLGAAGASELEEALERGRASIDAFFAAVGETLSAFLVEPLVQGAGGMRMWPPELLLHVRRACDRHGVLLIADEVMTGFGRTGTFFACERAGVVPDLLCLSKGLTGGALPLAVTCATDALFEEFWGEPAEHKAFLHGHSFTANPIACAAAAASLALFDETPVLDHAREVALALREAWQALGSHPAVRDARTLGTIAACRLVEPSTGAPLHASKRTGLAVHLRALERGLLVRPIGDCLYLLPPLASPTARVREAVATLTGCLDGA